MVFDSKNKSGSDNMAQGMSRSLALGRVLYFESMLRRRLGESRIQRYIRLYNYYAGTNLPPENVDQPLCINHFAPICDKHTSYLWGEYTNHVIDFRVSIINKDGLDEGQKQEADQIARRIKALLERVLFEENDGDLILDNAAENGAIYGDSVLEVSYSAEDRRIKIESVLPEYFHCMWQISNMERITEVIIAYPIDRVEALETYGSSGNDQFIGYQAINPHYSPGIGIIWKRWSTTSFQVWIDDVCVINQPNPYMQVDEAGNVYPGLIPFIHIPNRRAGSDFWGYSDGEAILGLSDELNRRMADMGDIVNVAAHPIVTLKNFSGEAEDLPIGPDAVWDLGREGEAERLEGSGPGPEAMAYLDKVKQEMQETANMPAMAYGTHQGSMSHVAGAAVALAMMPVTERARKKRLRWTKDFKRLCKMIFVILQVRDPDLLKAYGLTFEQIQLFQITPVWASVLPKDTLQVVNEQVATTANNLRSIERALEELGEDDIPSELARIKADMQLKSSMGMPATGTGGKNSDEGQGGSNQLPGGIGAKDGKPGVTIKSPDLDQVDSVAMKDTL
jgi:hypothetical protein